MEKGADTRTLSAEIFENCGKDLYQVLLGIYLCPDMEKGADTRTLSVEIFENCGNLFSAENYAPLFSEENLFVVDMFDETFNIWYIYSL